MENFLSVSVLDTYIIVLYDKCYKKAQHSIRYKNTNFKVRMFLDTLNTNTFRMAFTFTKKIFQEGNSDRGLVSRRSECVQLKDWVLIPLC